MKFLIFLAALLILNFDGVSQWILRDAGVRSRLNAASMLDSLTAVVVGDKGLVLRTTDGGSSWEIILPGTSQNLRACHFLSSDGFAIGDSVICHSTDSGTSWTSVIIPGHFTAVANGAAYIPVVIVGSQEGVLLISGDDGSHWSEMDLQGPVVSISTGYGALQSYWIYAATQDFVYHQRFENFWDSVKINKTIFDYFEAGDLYGPVQYLVGTGGDFVPVPIVYRRSSTDSIWKAGSGNLPPSITLTGVHAIPGSEAVYVCGSSGTIFRSDDGGGFWKQESTGTTRSLNGISSSDQFHGVAVGDSGTILMRYPQISAVAEYILPSELSLESFPNPFNPSTTIRFSLPARARVNLTIYDVLGRPAATLIEGEEPAGTKSILWSAEGSPSGLYFCRLIVSFGAHQRFTGLARIVLLR